MECPAPGENILPWRDATPSMHRLPRTVGDPTALVLTAKTPSPMLCTLRPEPVPLGH